MRDTSAEARRNEEASASRWWNGRLAFSLVALGSVLGFVMSARNWPREHDRHVVASRVREWEQTIRSDRPALGLFVQGNNKPGEEVATREARQQALADFERLGRLDDFAITDIVVEVHGDKALATYRVRGVTHLKSESVPRGGQLEFVRSEGRWQIAGHRVIE